MEKVKLGQYAEAIKDFDAAIGLKLEYAEAYCWRGRVKNLLKQYSTAISDFDQALRLKSDYADVYHWRGRAMGFQSHNLYMG